jgi:hypothetical protein
MINVAAPYSSRSSIPDLRSCPFDQQRDAALPDDGHRISLLLSGAIGASAASNQSSARWMCRS